MDLRFTCVQTTCRSTGHRPFLRDSPEVLETGTRCRPDRRRRGWCRGRRFSSEGDRRLPTTFVTPVTQIPDGLPTRPCTRRSRFLFVRTRRVLSVSHGGRGSRSGGRGAGVSTDDLCRPFPRTRPGLPRPSPGPEVYSGGWVPTSKSLDRHGVPVPQGGYQSTPLVRSSVGWVSGVLRRVNPDRLHNCLLEPYRSPPCPPVVSGDSSQVTWTRRVRPCQNPQAGVTSTSGPHVLAPDDSRVARVDWTPAKWTCWSGPGGSGSPEEWVQESARPNHPRPTSSHLSSSVTFPSVSRSVVTTVLPGLVSLRLPPLSVSSFGRSPTDPLSGGGGRYWSDTVTRSRTPEPSSLTLTFLVWSWSF